MDKKLKKSNKNNKLKISALTWNDKLELTDESCFVTDMQDYFEYIIKKHETVTANPSIRTYVNKMENKVTFETIV